MRRDKRTYQDRKEYLQKYHRERVAACRAEWFADKKCSNCGSHERLELDHINPGDKVSHKIWSWSEERRNSELVKCQVLCYICHKKKSATEMGFEYPAHGANRYLSGCRCDVCREGARQRIAKYRQKKKQLASGQIAS